MQTIPSYDLQEIPASYDDIDYNFASMPTLVSHCTISHANSVIVNLNATRTDDMMLRLQGHLDQATKEFLDHENEISQNEYYGF